MDEQERKLMFRKTFDAVAGGYDSSALRFFPESANHLASLLSLKGDEHVLDIATGTGNVALRLAEDVPYGHVTGIDFSRGMLDRANRKAEELNTKNIRFIEMDMQAIDFPDDHFDIAVSAFSIFFTADMERQLRHIAGKVRPGGKVAIITFFENSFSPLGEKFLARLEAYNVEIPPLTWKRVATEEQCTSLFRSADLKSINSHRNNNGYYLKDASDWWCIVWNGGFRGLVSQLSDNDLERFKAEHLDEIQALSTENGIWLEMNVLFTMGDKV